MKHKKSKSTTRIPSRTERSEEFLTSKAPIQTTSDYFNSAMTNFIPFESQERFFKKTKHVLNTQRLFKSPSRQTPTKMFTTSTSIFQSINKSVSQTKHNSFRNMERTRLTSHRKIRPAQPSTTPEKRLASPDKWTLQQLLKMKSIQKASVMASTIEFQTIQSESINYDKKKQSIIRQLNYETERIINRIELTGEPGSSRERISAKSHWEENDEINGLFSKKLKKRGIRLKDEFRVDLLINQSMSLKREKGQREASRVREDEWKRQMERQERQREQREFQTLRQRQVEKEAEALKGREIEKEKRKQKQEQRRLKEEKQRLEREKQDEQRALMRQLEEFRMRERQRQRLQYLASETEREREREREMELQRERQRKIQREREKKREREKERQRQMERQREMQREREKQLEREREREAEMERQRQESTQTRQSQISQINPNSNKITISSISDYQLRSKEAPTKTNEPKSTSTTPKIENFQDVIQTNLGGRKRVVLSQYDKFPQINERRSSRERLMEPPIIFQNSLSSSEMDETHEKSEGQPQSQPLNKQGDTPRVKSGIPPTPKKVINYEQQCDYLSSIGEIVGNGMQLLKEVKINWIVPCLPIYQRFYQLRCEILSKISTSSNPEHQRLREQMISVNKIIEQSFEKMLKSACKKPITEQKRELVTSLKITDQASFQKILDEMDEYINIINQFSGPDAHLRLAKKHILYILNAIIKLGSIKNNKKGLYQLLNTEEDNVDDQFQTGISIISNLN